MPTITPDEWDRARREDEVLKSVLEEAMHRRSMPMSTPESIQHGREIIAQSQERAAAAMPGRVACGELISAAALQHELAMDSNALAVAVREGRLFAIVEPDGGSYYPAYYADPTLFRSHQPAWHSCQPKSRAARRHLPWSWAAAATPQPCQSTAAD